MGKIVLLVSIALLLHTICVEARVPIPLQRLHKAKNAHIAKPAPLRASVSTPLLSAHTIGRGVTLPRKSDLRVDGRKIPLLKDQLQDSYAGRVPISSNGNDNRTLFFWYWPSSAKRGSDSLTIWLNGGPGCSSLGGFLRGNGAFTFKAGTTAPTVNPYAWSTISNMLYIDQPVSTGFSSGVSDLQDEYGVAEQFYGFLKNFYAVFPELLSKKLFIAGESYAGMYIPYISQRIVSASVEKKALPINLQSILVNDGLFTTWVFSQLVTLTDFVIENQKILGINDTVIESLRKNNIYCGLQGVVDQLTYPPNGPILFDGCLKSVSTSSTVPMTRQKKQILASTSDKSEFSDALFPGLVKTLPRGITLWHGVEDMLLFAKGTRFAIQNMTWAGHQGFQRPITQEIVLGGKPRGVQHSERGITIYEIADAGHMIPADQPSVALEVLRTVIGGGSLVHTNGGTH